MNKLKKTLVCLMITCTTSLSNAHVLNGEGCDSFTMSKLSEALKDKKSQYLKNPFNKHRCVPIVMESKDNLNLSKSDFAGSNSLFNIYKDFLDSPNTMVSQIKVSGNKLVKLFKIDENNHESQRIKDKFSKKKILSSKYNEWTFFHELMHLSERNESDFKNTTKAEATADIGSVLMISITNNMGMDETIDLLDELYHLRRKDASFESGRTGQKAAIMHYNKTSFLNARNNLKEIKSAGFSLSIPIEDDLSNMVQIIDELAYDMQNSDKDDFKLKYIKNKHNDAIKNLNNQSIEI